LHAEIEKLGKVKAGAGVAAQKRAQELQAAGVDPQKILSDPAIIKHQAAFNDAGSTLKAKEEEIRGLEAQLAERNKQIASYQAELQQMQRNVVNLRQEKHSALADTAIAKQQEAISNMLAGISEDTTDRDLQAAREARTKAQNRAKISADLAGNDAKLAENEYLDYADKVAQDSEFTSLLNLDSGKKETAAPTPVMEPAKLPPQ
jgi:phage shock protein A